MKWIFILLIFFTACDNSPKAKLKRQIDALSHKMIREHKRHEKIIDNLRPFIPLSEDDSLFLEKRKLQVKEFDSLKKEYAKY